MGAARAALSSAIVPFHVSGDGLIESNFLCLSFPCLV